MSRESRRILGDGIYNLIREIRKDIRVSEIYGVFEVIEMDLNDRGIEESKKKGITRFDLIDLDDLSDSEAHRFRWSL